MSLGWVRLISSPMDTQMAFTNIKLRLERSNSHAMSTSPTRTTGGRAGFLALGNPLTVTRHAKPFVVFEGLDGSGTSTQATKLAGYLSARGHNVVVTSEPSNGPIGQLIRQGMSHRLKFSENELVFDRQMAYLFAADRHDHLYNDTDGVMKHIKEGKHVISTRYYFSSYAYHCGPCLPFDFIHRLNDSFPPPDVLIYLDVPPSVSYRRIMSRSRLDAYENIEKLERVKANYESVLANYKGAMLRVNAADNIDNVHTRIISFIEELVT
jgi:dTMP kinase